MKTFLAWLVLVAAVTIKGSAQRSSRNPSQILGYQEYRKRVNIVSEFPKQLKAVRYQEQVPSDKDNSFQMVSNNDGRDRNSLSKSNKFFKSVIKRNLRTDVGPVDEEYLTEQRKVRGNENYNEDPTSVPDQSTSTIVFHEISRRSRKIKLPTRKTDLRTGSYKRTKKPQSSIKIKSMHTNRPHHSKDKKTKDNKDETTGICNFLAKDGSQNDDNRRKDWNKWELKSQSEDSDRFNPKNANKIYMDIKNNVQDRDRSQNDDNRSKGWNKWDLKSKSNDLDTFPPKRVKNLKKEEMDISQEEEMDISQEEEMDNKQEEMDNKQEEEMDNKQEEEMDLS